ncbi:sugar phosphate nucleotidyltransferase [Terribacillus saccharophilus]|uniref:sugar phosphate nucleotidyltransferase n=1 Tax=Terribacillus saccharophilus TaxID=361277 RepID=UPI002989B542|nr:sugar phosphate nucleotidyltransferase [Terribacillus saccharophilus]MCM3225236.1 sugar phosphate nucleotidyltransferase [Terribacillus saccharophilus]
MKYVLLSGGSGTRLWPLSNNARSKQFIKVLPKTENEGLESMVQRVWSQLKSEINVNDVLIATSKSQVEMIKDQIIDEVKLVTEPSRRDTFAAIALSASYLHSEMGCDLDEVVSVLPVDPYVESTFYKTLNRMGDVLKRTQAELVLLGVTPTFPSEKYGYIVPDNTSDDYSLVKAFKEKPNYAMAKELMDSNAKWNCGVFTFRLGYLLNILEEKGLPVKYNDLLSKYNEIPKISFDYEVVEKCNKVAMVSYNGFWKDLGTWNTLTEEIKDNVIGIGKIEDSVENSHIINELDIPIALIGLDNVIVGASPDGILVSSKESSPKIKTLINEFNGRPMYEERRWGWYKVLDHTDYEKNLEVLTKKIKIKAGKNLSYHYHKNRKETWTISKGDGEIIIEGEIRSFKAGDTISVSSLTRHAIRANTEVELIEVQIGTELIEEDIHRIELEWDKITLKL